MRKYPIPHWRDIIAIALLFSVALCIRLSYQENSIIDTPIRADAREYFFTAYNLYHFKVYSSAPPRSDNTPPEPDNLRLPVYPLFLYPFIALSKTTGEFLNSVTLVQAIIGSFTVILAYLISRMGLNLMWAFMAALFTALIPHLIAVDDFVLTESLLLFP